MQQSIFNEVKINLVNYTPSQKAGCDLTIQKTSSPSEITNSQPQKYFRLVLVKGVVIFNPGY